MKRFELLVVSLKTESTNFYHVFQTQTTCVLIYAIPSAFGRVLFVVIYSREVVCLARDLGF